MARRQWVATADVDDDIQHVDHAANEAHEEPHDSVVEDVAADSLSFLGGPQDTLVLTTYADHVAAKVWVREVVICLIITYLNGFVNLMYLINYNYLHECIELKLASHGRKVEKLGRLALEVEG